MPRFGFVLFGCVLVGCGPAEEVTTTTTTGLATSDPTQSESTLGCIADFAVSDGYGHDGADIEAIEALCVADGGSDCASEDMISYEAALCISQVHFVQKSLDKSYYTILRYLDNDEEVTWYVESLAFEESYKWGGEWMKIHAMSGSVLQQGEWKGMY